jgi:hypothetical protein
MTAGGALDVTRRLDARRTKSCYGLKPELRKQLTAVRNVAVKKVQKSAGVARRKRNASATVSPGSSPAKQLGATKIDITLEGEWFHAADQITYVRPLCNGKADHLDEHGRPLQLTVIHHRVLQHTIVFESPIVLAGDVTITLGTLNLYAYPKCVGATGGSDDLRERLLHDILVALAMSNPDIFESHDASGASPMHCLCIANTRASLDLSMHLFKLQPQVTSLTTLAPTVRAVPTVLTVPAVPAVLAAVHGTRAP